MGEEMGEQEMGEEMGEQEIGEEVVTLDTPDPNKTVTIQPVWLKNKSTKRMGFLMPVKGYNHTEQGRCGRDECQSRGTIIQSKGGVEEVNASQGVQSYRAREVWKR
ncbi:hypothetical protein Btru_072069 [Bulinus truncatus]|nr:hypothetical protein Btru_072069 [Bulinus truncatus]